MTAGNARTLEKQGGVFGDLLHAPADLLHALEDYIEEDPEAGNGARPSNVLSNTPSNIPSNIQSNVPSEAKPELAKNTAANAKATGMDVRKSTGGAGLMWGQNDAELDAVQLVGSDRWT